MKKHLKKDLFAICSVLLLIVGVGAVMPHFIFAASPLDPGYLIVCGSKTTPPCEVKHFFILARNVLELLFFLAVPATFFGCAYAGYLYMTAQDNTTKTTKAKKIFHGIIIGFLFIAGAWLIVYALVDPILNKDVYKLFEV